MPRILPIPFSVVFALSALARIPLLAQDNSYLDSIKPVLRERCYSCHGALEQKAGLRVDTVASLLQGGESGPALEPGHPQSSLILRRVNAADPDLRMPPEGEPLGAETKNALHLWILAGSPAPSHEEADSDAGSHWAFQPPQRPGLSPGELAAGANPIDLLLARAGSAAGVRPQPLAPPETQLRRLYLDLVGLPPSREDLHSFLASPHPDRFVRTADRLLASPQHGQRWARHWMDIWRYSDWYGLDDQLRNSQKHIWRWRDWIVDSLNRDAGYDRMILEMLAADELAPEDSDTLRATGFLARNYYLFNRSTWLDSTIEHTGKAFLGLTIQCAKCHDHKYDPIRQIDYYRFRALFEPHQIRLDAVPGTINFDRDGLPRAFDAHPDALTYLHRRGNENDPDTSSPIAPGIPAFLETGAFAIHPVALPRNAWAPGTQRVVRQNWLSEAGQAIRTAQAGFTITANRFSQEQATPAEAQSLALASARRLAAQLQLEALQARIRADDTLFTGATDPHAQSLAANASRAEKRRALAHTEADLLDLAAHLANSDRAGDHEALREKLRETEKQLAADRQALLQRPADTASYRPLPGSRQALETPEHQFDSYPAVYPRQSTGRRLALARWIVDPKNPLTPRVAANHVWTRCFGQSLVNDPADFGRRSPRPPLHEILDFLAVELLDHHWDLEHLHRLIVNSEAFRRHSSFRDADPQSLARDPDNVLLWRYPARRMEAQVLRDALFYLSGNLDLSLGGPSLDPRQPAPAPRRSLYFKHSRDDQDLFLGLFDDAPIQECYRRTESIVPQQALALANSREAFDAAAAISRRLHHLAPSASDAAFFTAAFETVLGRAPDSSELAYCADALSSFRQLEGDLTQTGSGPRAQLVHALLNHNDFITIR
ncbi:MAG TPA: PSD1 and planctomycete cytochrome C domain-containing protein [Verrucomicrobiales bacterium]|nr:PSD1 and planctomycete cytochrome C domain-containing protein [Verrucomicrobiales bacterium]